MQKKNGDANGNRKQARLRSSKNTWHLEQTISTKPWMSGKTKEWNKYSKNSKLTPNPNPNRTRITSPSMGWNFVMSMPSCGHCAASHRKHRKPLRRKNVRFFLLIFALVLFALLHLPIVGVRMPTLIASSAHPSSSSHFFLSRLRRNMLSNWTVRDPICLWGWPCPSNEAAFELLHCCCW